MKRLFALLALGAVFGGIVQLVGDGDTVAPDRSPSAHRERFIESVSEPSPGELEIELLNLITRTFGDAERAGVEALAQRASRADLEALARLVAALPNLRGKPVVLDSLLSRYAVLDRDAALALARELGADDDLLATLRGAGMLDLPAAIRDAERLPQDERRGAFERLAVAAVAQDAPAALAYGAGLADDAHAEFSAAVFREWARRDPEAMLRYVASLDSTGQQAALGAGGLEAFAQLEPQRMLEIAGRVPGEPAHLVRALALVGLARRNPFAAIGYVETLAPGPERTQLLDVAARGYAVVDPESALAWAQALDPPAPEAVVSVLAGLVPVDPDRAVELLFAMPQPPQRQAQLQSLITRGLLTDEQTAALASRWPLSGRGRQELRWLTAAWARQSPESAVEWLLANGDRAHPGNFADAAQSLGRKAPAAVDAYLHRIPSELQPRWLQSAADGYAQTDPTAAARWLAKYADESGYDAAMATVARRAARSDPPAAARLFANVDVGATPASVGAANIIAARWATRDVPAARAWALALPSGDVRNAALTPVLTALATERGAVEPALLAAFSDAAAGQRALSQAIVAVARSDTRAAQRLVDEYLVDPELRRQAQELIARSP